MNPGGDLFGRLPDELLSHVLSFLPSHAAVQASCLSRRWRHLWRSAPAVRVRGKGDAFVFFVSNLLIGRDTASAPPLHSFEIDADLKTRLGCVFCEKKYCQCESFFCFDEDRWEVNPHVDMWVTQALSACRACSLTARFDQQGDVLWKPRCPFPFASRHLTRIHLDTVYLVDGQLDFSCCPALLRLTLVGCGLYGDTLVSPSLERLVIVDCQTDIHKHPEEDPDERLHTSLSMPRLRFLEISDNYDKEHFIEMMPWLTEQSISYTQTSAIYDDDDDDDDDDDSRNDDDDDNDEEEEEEEDDDDDDDEEEEDDDDDDDNNDCSGNDDDSLIDTVLNSLQQNAQYAAT